MNQPPGNPLPLFCSYAHEDEVLRNALDKHLILLQHNGLITTKDDRHIMPGTDRSHIICQYLKESAVILLLISPDYLASASCYTTEMPLALERHRMGSSLVIPVLLRPIDLDGTPFAHLQCLPRNGRPVALWEHQDAAWHEIAKELRHLLENMRATTPSLPPSFQLISYQPAIQTQDRDQTRNHDEIEYRTRYLKHLLGRYSTVTLPIGPVEGLTLQAIFQPLTLRYDPLAAEDLQREQRRTLFDERTLQREQPQSIVDDNQTVSQGEKSIIVAQTSEEALEKSPQKRMVILGGPGTGKTTVLQFLIHQQAQKALADPAVPLPIMISLPDLARSEKTLSEYLLRLAKEARVPDHEATLLERAFDAGRAFLCLDSLDEVAPEQRPGMIRLINELATSTGNVWIIGSRFTEYKGGQFQRGQFAEWELQPMTHGLRQELANRLLPELVQHFRRRNQACPGPLAFVHHLEAHTQAATWGENPLLFSLAAVVFVRLGTLPSSRAALYEEVTRAVVETREKNPARRQVLRRVLTDLALTLYTTKGRTFSLDYLVSLLPDIRLRLHENWETDEMARRLISSGLFDTFPQDTYGFRHQTFQEYLAAGELASRLVAQDQALHDDAWAFARSKRRFARWTEVLRLMVGILVQNHHKEGTRMARDWLRALVAQHDTPEGDPGNLELALALKSLAEIAETTSRYWHKEGGNKVEEELVANWVARLLDTSQRGYTAQQRHLERLSSEIIHLHHLVAKVANERTKAALRDNNSEIRATAICELGMLGACAPAEPLVVALHDEERVIRASAATALGKLRKNIPVQPLLVAAHDEHEAVRAAAIAALGKLDESAPPEPLLAALDDSAWSVRRAAVKALGKPGIHISLDQMITIMQDDDSTVRAAVVRALASMGAQAPQEPLLAALRDQAWEVREAGTRVLTNFGDQMPIDPLVHALNVGMLNYRTWLYTEEYRARKVIIQSLTKQIDRVPTELLRVLIENASKDSRIRKYWPVRSSVLEVVAKMGERAPLPLALAALNDEIWPVRRSAVQAIGELKITAARDTILAILNNGDEDQWVRVATVEALAKLETDGGIDILLAALNDPIEAVRTAAAKNLAKSKTDSSMEQLLTTACEQITWIRVAAVAMLGKLGENAPIDLLLALLNDENEADAVRAAAGQTLVNLGEYVPVKVMRTILHYKDTKIRQGIAQKFSDDNLLAFIEDTPVISLLLALEYRDEDICKQVAMKLHYNRFRWRSWEPGNAKRRLLTLKNWLHSHEKPVVPVALLESLVEFLEKEDYGTSKIAAQTLGELKTYISLDLMQKLFASSHDEQSQMRVGVFEALRILGYQLPSHWLAEAMTHEDWQCRKTAVYTMSLRKESIFVRPLLNALNDSQWQVRVAAAEALAEMNKPSATKPLLNALNDPQWQVRVAAIEALAQMNKPSATKPLLNALNDPQWQVRVAAIEALAKMNKPSATKPLLNALNDPQWQVRVAVAEALAEMKEPPAVDALLTALHDEEWCVRLAVATTLLAFTIPFSPSLVLEALAHPDAVPYLGSQPLSDTGNSEKRKIVRLVAQILDKAGAYLPREMLLSAALQSEHRRIRKAAIQSLIKHDGNIPGEVFLTIMDQEGIGPQLVRDILSEMDDVPMMLLEDLFNQGTTRVRRSIAQTLVRRREKTPEELLLRVMDDGDPSIQKSVAWELARAGANIPTEFLIEALQRGSPRMRQTVAMTLERMKEDIPTKLLLTALHDQDLRVRYIALSAMDNPEAQVPLEPLLTCLHTETEDNGMLYLIVRLLGGRGLEEQVPLEPILNLFDREFVRLRASVIRILGRFGGNDHVEKLLIATLGDSEQLVRDAAAAALKQAYPEALRALTSESISILQGQKAGAPFDSIAQAFFADTVMNMGYASPAIFERLTQLLDWPYWQVRLKAIRAFGKLRRNIPDKAIRHLYELRHDPQSRAVREAADQVLAEILSLETGIEDD